MNIRLRLATAADQGFLDEMLFEAAFWDPSAPDRPSLDVAMQAPENRHYSEDFGRPGDLGVVAFDGESGDLLGAAWLRVLPPEDPGYGYIDARTPELSIACRESARRRGIGRLMLVELLRLSAEAGVRRVSLSVSLSNPARRLYQQLGFVDHGEPDGGSITMVRQAS